MAAKVQPSPREIPPLEWLVAGAGALLVAATIGYLTIQALWRDGTPPDLRIEGERPFNLGNGWLVRFHAVNEGGEPVAQLVVEGDLIGPGGSVEAAWAILDFVAPRSEAAGGLFFSRNPDDFELHLHPRGYARP